MSVRQRQEVQEMLPAMKQHQTRTDHRMQFDATVLRRAGLRTARMDPAALSCAPSPLLYPATCASRSTQRASDQRSAPTIQAAARTYGGMAAIFMASYTTSRDTIPLARQDREPIPPVTRCLIFSPDQFGPFRMAMRRSDAKAGWPDRPQTNRFWCEAHQWLDGSV